MRWFAWCGVLGLALACGESQSHSGAPSTGQGGGTSSGAAGVVTTGGEGGESEPSGSGGEGANTAGRAGSENRAGESGATAAGTGGTTSDGGRAGSGSAGALGDCSSDGVIPAYCQPRRLDAGLAHTCLLRESGEITCWGYNTFDVDGWVAVESMSEPPSGAFEWLSIGTTSCAFDAADRPNCWSVFPRFDVPNEPLLDYTSSHEGFQCAVHLDGTVSCPAIDLTDLATEGPFVQASSSPGFACVLSSEGAAHCRVKSDVTLEIGPPATPLQSIVTGNAHACGLDLEGNARCWGRSASGETNPPADRFVQLSADGNSTCGVRTDGTIACWGETRVAPEGEFREVAVGSQPNSGGVVDHVCALREDGKVACWDRRGGLLFQSLPPSDIAVEPEEYKAFAVGGEAVNQELRSTEDSVPIACRVRADGALDCFRNGPFELAVPEGEFEAVAVGIRGGCAIRDDGSLACFQDEPNPAPSGSFRQVSVGLRAGCAIDLDDAVVCWNLVTGEVVSEPDGSFDQVAVVPGSYEDAFTTDVCGIVGGDLRFWDSYGEIELAGPFLQVAPSADAKHLLLRPDGGITSFVVDTAIGMINAFSRDEWGTGYSKLAAGDDVHCALRADGSIAFLPESGDPVTTASGSERFVDISGAGDYCCGLTGEGQFHCFGAIIH